MPPAERAGRATPGRKTRFTGACRREQEAVVSRKLKLMGALGVIALAIPVASVLGRGAGQSSGPGQSSAKATTVETSAVHEVAVPSTVGPAGAAAKSRPKPLKLAYFETPRKTVKEGRSGLVVGPVPKNCNVLNGYYFVPGNLNSTAILSMGDSPAGLRKWAFYRDNEAGKPITGVKYGVICAKHAGVISG
jgi:hypothetical protein